MSSSIHNNPYVRDLLGPDARKVKAEALRTARLKLSAHRWADRMLDKTEAERAEAAIVETGIGNDVAYGHSMGGLIAHALRNTY